MKCLPFQATTATGTSLSFEFPLHPETGDPVRVSQLVSELLATLDRELKTLGETGNGDVLQALTMALAVRARMIHTDPHVSAELARALAEIALAAGKDGLEQQPKVGHS